MTARKKQIKYNIICFACLFLVSLYRQFSLRYWPEDPFRTTILYIVYILLLVIWTVSILARVVQKSIRKCLLLEDALMFCGLTLRFVQDTFWMDNISLMRTSGLVLSAALLPMALLEFYAAFGIGQPDDYHIPKPLWILSLPIILMLLATITDDQTHFFFTVSPGETKPNLNFHPGLGILLVYIIFLILSISRCFVIYHRNKMLNKRPYALAIISFIEPLLILIATFKYLLVMLDIASFLSGFEVIELYAEIYYAVILTWEIYIYLGLVPTNSDYRDIFMHSTVSMQIVSADGTNIISKTATPVSDAALKELLQKGSVSAPNNNELHLYPLKDGSFIWNQDTAELVHTIHELGQIAEALEQEGTLLEEELRTKDEEAKLNLQNQIYDELTGKVSTQLRLMKEIAKKRHIDTDKSELLRMLYLLGTYVKRRCNLQLIMKETGEILFDDLLLSFRDMVSALRFMGIEAELNQTEAPEYSAEFSIFLFDTFENLLEYNHFRLKGAAVSLKADSTVFSLHGTETESLNIHIPDIYKNRLSLLPDGYELTVWEGGEKDVS